VASILIACLVAFVAPGFANAQGQAQSGRKPMLIEGKRTLFERVLSRPGAAPAAQPGGPPGRRLAPMTVLHVYGRAVLGGLTWLEVGTDADGRIAGFLPESDTVPWRHGLVMAFASPANRDRVLFFDRRETLTGLLDDERLLIEAEAMRARAAKGEVDPAGRVRSIEPETWVDMRSRFYLLPVLEARTEVLKTGFRVRAVKVAAVTATADPPPQAQRANPGAADDFRAGIVFVVDASSSMQPYIDQTRQAIERVLGQIEAAGLADKARFGVVAYRDDPTKTRGMDFLTRTFVDPNQARDRAGFLSGVRDLRAAQSSTRAFAEDGFAGLVHALSALDWSGFGARHLVLVTDASSREATSPFASTGLDTERMRDLLQRRGTALFVLHLLTDEGRADHPAARAQYQTLARFENVEPLYFPVESGDVQRFRTTVDVLAEALVRQVREAGGPLLVRPPAAAGRVDRLADEVGRAMRLAYLGRAQGATAPSMFEAWASDRDFRRPEAVALTVHALLSKNQLSDLQATLTRVVAAGERGQVDPGDFFNQLRSAALAMSRDPARIGQGALRDLAAVGLMGEYLDGLPYQSRLMALDQDQWTRMGVGQQQALIDELKAKIVLYQRFHDDVDRWVRLDESTRPGDAVYPIPLDSLP
jgi:hypothetical protein